MVWDLGVSDARDFITEGNVPCLLIKKKHRKIQFLFEMFDAGPYTKKGMSEEEVKELFQSKLKLENWYEPIAHWEHTIIEVGKFSTTACSGTKCSNCEANDGARNNGVTENKMLPFPVRKMFVLPVWVYELERVLFIKQAQQFYEEIGAYAEKHGNGMDFDIYKTGSSLGTRYHSIFAGKADLIKAEVMMPNELDFISPENKDFKEFAEADVTLKDLDNKFMGGKNPKGVGAFVIDFGDYKDKTLKEIWDSGDKEFLDFLVMKTDGVVREEAEKFLKEMEMRKGASIGMKDGSVPVGKDKYLSELNDNEIPF